MNSKEYLEEVHRLDIIIACKKEELIRAEQSAMFPSGRIDTSGATRQNHDNERLHHAVLKIDELKTQLAKVITDSIEKKKEIMSVVDSLSDPIFTDILYRRYFQHKRIETIAKELHYSYVWIYELHNRALTEIDQRLNKS